MRQVTAPAAVSAGTPPTTAAAGSSPQALTFDSLGRALQAVDVTLNVLTGNTADVRYPPCYKRCADSASFAGC